MNVARDEVSGKVRDALTAVLQDEQRGNGARIAESMRLVDDLGFDSVRMASLTIELEEQFGEVLLLSDWIAEAGSPSDLTVASLVDYLCVILAENG